MRFIGGINVYLAANTTLHSKAVKKRKTKTGIKLFLMISPFLVLTFVFSYFPLYGWIYSFYDFRPPLKLFQCDFVGLFWFESFISSPARMQQILEVLRNTFAMSGLGILTSWLPIVFAVFLTEIKARGLKRVCKP
jgi:ABC-type polysaccharide transport system, permease component